MKALSAALVATGALLVMGTMSACDPVPPAVSNYVDVVDEGAPTLAAPLVVSCPPGQHEEGAHGCVPDSEGAPPTTTNPCPSGQFPEGAAGVCTTPNPPASTTTWPEGQGPPVQFDIGDPVFPSLP